MAKFKLVTITMGLLYCSFMQIHSQSIDIKKAAIYFQEAKELAAKDNGSLWGINLYGPLVFVDRQSREAVANFPVPVEGWKKTNGVYHGYMPEGIGFANTAFEWDGELWSMIIYISLPSDKNERISLMMHELWHQHEKKLDIVSNYNIAKHIDKKMGRMLLFLEWNALLKACNMDGKHRTRAIRDALAFRKTRFEEFPEGFQDEMAKELHEGMAEYTGMTLCGWEDTGKLEFLTKKVASKYEEHTLSWIYAYTSGALYGYLLDKQSPGWNKKLQKNSDLGKLLSQEYGTAYTSFSKEQIKIIGASYGYDTIARIEEERVRIAELRQKEYKRRFEEGYTLFLPNHELKIQFNPQKITPYGNAGTVYDELMGLSKWGEIKVKFGGILMLKGWKGLVLDVPLDWDPKKSLKTDRYEINLSGEYEIVKTTGGWIVEKSK